MHLRQPIRPVTTPRYLTSETRETPPPAFSPPRPNNSANVHQTQQHTSHLTRRNSSIPPKENLGTYCSTTVGTRPAHLRPVRSPQQRPQKGHGKSGEKEKKEGRNGKAKSGNVTPRSLRSPVQAATRGTSKFLPACCPVLGVMFHSVSPIVPLCLLIVSSIHTRWLAGHHASLQVCLVCLCASCILCFSLSSLRLSPTQLLTHTP